MISLINGIPKAELHVHLEGTIEAELMFAIAERNGVALKFDSVGSLQKAYRFKDLRDFLILYNEGTKVLLHERDFYEITLAYLRKAARQNVIHTEIFIDFQTYMRRGMDPAVIMAGISQAIDEAKEKWDISVELIHCFLRHLGAAAAEGAMKQVLRFKDHIIGVGLASTENGFPPDLFIKVFEEARNNGFKTVAHAGEEGPWEYVRDSIDLLKVDRIDHGNSACQNRALVDRIIESQIPLTLCPISNIKLKNVDRLENHTLKKMLHNNLLVTINSDDPSYFGAYVNENFIAVAKALEMSAEDVYLLAKNSFKASFISQAKKEEYISRLDVFFRNYRKEVL